MAITGAITAAATIGSAVVGNQQKQKAKGQAAQVERDSQTAQAAADAKLKEQHDQNVLAQSQAGAVERKALGGTNDDVPSTAGAGMLGKYKPNAAQGIQQPPGAVHTLLSQQPIQRKALLGS